jgi:hypothetical protein
MIEIKQNTASIALVFELRNSEGLPVTGASPTVLLSKNGGLFASPAGAVAEVGNGLYRVAANATDSNTLGILALYAAAVGALDSSMAYAVVANLESDSVAAIAGLNNLSAGQVRAELATELGRIDVAVSTRNATAPDNAGIAAIQAKTDALPADPAAASDVPTIAEIIGAAGGLTSETVAALEAAEQILLASPYEPGEAPVIVVPAPQEDESLAVVYIYTESITNVRRAGVEVTLALVDTPAKSERVLEIAAKTMTTNAEGFAQMTVQRGKRYRVDAKDLGLLGVVFTPDGETFNLADLIA